MIPAGLDLGAEVLIAFDLVEIEAPSGVARFLPGTDGVFTDIDGNRWIGSQLMETGTLDWARDGTAAAASLRFTWFQDPDAPDLIAQMKDAGDHQITGAAVRFYVQFFESHEQMFAPRWPPVLIATRVARNVLRDFSDPVRRALELRIDAGFAWRRATRRLMVTVPDHNALLGHPDPENPSLSLVPQPVGVKEKLYG